MLPPRLYCKLITSETNLAHMVHGNGMYGRCRGESEGAVGMHAESGQGRSRNDCLRPPVDSLTQLRHHYNDYMLQTTT